MITFIIISFIIPFLIRSLIKSNKKQHYPIKVSEKVWITPNGIVDFNEGKKLNHAQELHNRMVDFEISQRDREYQHQCEQDKLMGRITMVGPRKIIAMKYTV